VLINGRYFSLLTVNSGSSTRDEPREQSDAARFRKLLGNTSHQKYIAGAVGIMMVPDERRRLVWTPGPHL
jgi:hypothetical protein